MQLVKYCTLLQEWGNSKLVTIRMMHRDGNSECLRIYIWKKEVIGKEND